MGNQLIFLKDLIRNIWKLLAGHQNLWRQEKPMYKKDKLQLQNV